MTGMRVRILQVKFCQQCGRKMIAGAVRGKLCPPCEEERRLILEPFTKRVQEPVKVEKKTESETPVDQPFFTGMLFPDWLTTPFKNEVTTLEQDGGALQEDLRPGPIETETRALKGDGVAALEEDLQPGPLELMMEALDGDDVSVTEEDCVERMEAERQPLSPALERKLAKPEPIRKSEVEPERESTPEPIEEEPESLKEETPPEEERELHAETEGETSTEQEQASWIPGIKKSEDPPEREKQPTTTKMGMVEGAQVTVVRGPFKELFEEHLSGKTATVKLVNRRKRCVTIDLGSTTITVPIDHLEPA